MPDIEITSGYNHIDEVLELFREYKSELNVDVSFQPSDETEAEITKVYDKIYIALVDSKVAGCVAFHKMANNTDCELKRLFVREKFRGLHIGRLLLQHAIDEVKKLNYNAIYLDTLTTLKPACRLYEKFGFEKIAAYYHNPLPDVCYYKLELNKHIRRTISR